MGMKTIKKCYKWARDIECYENKKNTTVYSKKNMGRKFH